MDKFFIQAAFKSLDDIDKTENINIKKALIESRLKEKEKREKKYPLGKGECLNICAGNPDINTAAFNHATTINDGSPVVGLGEALDNDELYDKYVGKTVAISPDNKNYHDQVGEITGLVDGGNSFEDSKWELYLSQGTRLELPGKQLILEEKKIAESVEDDLKELDKIKKSLNATLSEDLISTKNKFDLRSDEDIKDAKEKLDKNKEPDKQEFIVVHPLNVHKKAEAGDAILQCNNCKETYYLNKEELVSDQGNLEENKVYNIDYQCDHCGANDGYVYVGDLATQDSEEAQKLTQDVKNEEDTENDLSSLPLEPIDNVEEPEEIVEESFDNLINSYGNKLYENLKSYKTTSITQTDRNKYVVEGIITLNDDKSHSTSFLLEVLKNNNNKILFKGGNSTLVESISPFRFVGSIKDKKLIFESMRYRYVENLNKEKYLVEGIEKNK